MIDELRDAQWSAANYDRFDVWRRFIAHVRLDGLEIGGWQ